MRETTNEWGYERMGRETRVDGSRQTTVSIRGNMTKELVTCLEMGPVSCRPRCL